MCEDNNSRDRESDLNLNRLKKIPQEKKGETDKSPGKDSYGKQ